MITPFLKMIVAATEQGVIGKDGKLPWRQKNDLRRFRMLTTGGIIIMGRKTHESIGHLLPNRHTCILTRNPEYTVDGAYVFHDVESLLRAVYPCELAFVVGGQCVYELLLDYVQTVYVTRIFADIKGDTFIPKTRDDFMRVYSSPIYPANKKNEHKYSFEIWERLPDEDSGT